MSQFLPIIILIIIVGAACAFIGRGLQLSQKKRDEQHADTAATLGALGAAVNSLGQLLLNVVVQPGAPSAQSSAAVPPALLPFVPPPAPASATEKPRNWFSLTNILIGAAILVVLCVGAVFLLKGDDQHGTGKPQASSVEDIAAGTSADSFDCALCNKMQPPGTQAAVTLGDNGQPEWNTVCEGAPQCGTACKVACPLGTTPADTVCKCARR